MGKIICAKLQTLTKPNHLHFPSSEIVKTLRDFFLRSRLDETTGVRLIPAIDNSGLGQQNGGQVVHACGGAAPMPRKAGHPLAGSVQCLEVSLVA